MTDEILDPSSSDLLDQIRKAAAEGRLLEEMSKVGRNQSDAFLRQIVELHNGKELNVISVLLTARKDATDGSRFFLIRDCALKIIPNIDSPTEEVMYCIVHILRESKGDMTSSFIVEPFIDYCMSQINRPDEAIKIA